MSYQMTHVRKSAVALCVHQPESWCTLKVFLYEQHGNGLLPRLKSALASLPLLLRIATGGWVAHQMLLATGGSFVGP